MGPPGGDGKDKQAEKKKKKKFEPRPAGGKKRKKRRGPQGLSKVRAMRSVEASYTSLRLASRN